MESLRIVKKFFPDVEKVKDGTKDLTIEVTAADVKSAGAKNHKGCAMANACKRALKLDGALVSLGTVFLIKDEVALRYRVPASLSRELVAFDRGGSFVPGEYDLRKPEPASTRPRATHKGKPTAGYRGTRHITGGVRTSLVSAI